MNIGGVKVRFAWRSSKFFEEPGWFLLVGNQAVCIIPFPKKDWWTK